MELALLAASVENGALGIILPCSYKLRNGEMER